MRSRYAWVASTGETARDSINRESSATVRKGKFLRSHAPSLRLSLAGCAQPVVCGYVVNLATPRCDSPAATTGIVRTQPILPGPGPAPTAVVHECTSHCLVLGLPGVVGILPEHIPGVPILKPCESCIHPPSRHTALSSASPAVIFSGQPDIKHDCVSRPIAGSARTAQTRIRRSQVYKIGIDVGGTFTDFVVGEEGGQPRFFKTQTTPDDPSTGVMNGLQEAA